MSYDTKAAFITLVQTLAEDLYPHVREAAQRLALEDMGLAEPQPEDLDLVQDWCYDLIDARVCDNLGVNLGDIAAAVFPGASHLLKDLSHDIPPSTEADYC